MKLMTKALEKRFAQVGCQETVKDPIVIAKYFYPMGSATWYATEYDPERRLFFGYVSLFGDSNDEWGYFSLAELESFTGRFGLGIERDLFWQEMPASKAIASRA